MPFTFPGRTAAVVSFRLGGPDGVSVEAAKWVWALDRLGFEVRTVAGEGRADVIVRGLAAGAQTGGAWTGAGGAWTGAGVAGTGAGGAGTGAGGAWTGAGVAGTGAGVPWAGAGGSRAGMGTGGPEKGDGGQGMIASGEGAGAAVNGGVRLRSEVEAALTGADLVVVENLCSLPLNPVAGEVVAEVLAGRPAVLHHHDLAWQRPQFPTSAVPPDDPAWLHVAINDLSRRELAERGIAATTIRNAFHPRPPAGRREHTRALLGVAGDERLVVHPSRALDRKGVPEAVALAEALDATYWLLGPAEDGYGPTLDKVLAEALVPVHHGRLAELDLTVADAYAACDAVVFPSSWEGFGNPVMESALYRRPLALSRYPVAEELATFGFRWFPAKDPAPLDSWLRRPAPYLLDHNQALARSQFSLYDLPARLAALLRAGSGNS